MHFLILLAIQIVLSIVSALLFRPKGPSASPVSIPTTDAATPIPVLFGRGLLSGNVIAFLNYRPHEVDTGINNYSASMIVALCIGEVTKLWDIISDTGHRFSEIPDVTYVASITGTVQTGQTVTYATAPVAGITFPFDVPTALASDPLNEGDAILTVRAPRLYGDKDTGGGVTGKMHFYAGTRNQSQNLFWANFPLPAMPGVSYTVDAAGLVTVFFFFQRDIRSIRYATSTTTRPDFAAVTGGTLVAGKPWSFNYSSLTSGQTLYVGVLGYNALGTPSPLGTFSITFAGSAIEGQPLAVGTPGSTLGTVPAYPNLCYITYENTILGQNSTPRPLGFELQRSPRGFPSEFYLDDALSQNEGDANPIAIIYELMTDRLWGIGLNDSELDLAASWQAASVYCCINSGTDQLFLSYVLDNQASAQEYIDEVYRTIDAVPFIDPASGKLGIQLIRGDYDPATLPLYNESNILDSDFTQGAAQETVNEVKVTFTDRSRLYKKNQVSAKNTASVLAVGRVVSTTIEYKGVTREDLALRLAQRDLRALSTPLAKATLVVNRSGFDLHEGSPFRYSWARAGVSEMVMRVAKITRGGRNDSKLTIECVQDVFAIPAAPAYAPSGVTYNDPSHGMPNAVPVVTVSEDRDATTGYVSLVVDDPDTRLTLVEFQTQSGQSTLSAWAPASYPYHTSVTLDAQYASLIHWRVTYARPDGTLATETGTVTFDVLQKPPAPQLTYTITTGGVLAVTAIVGSNVASVKFADSTSGPPDDTTTRAGTADSSAPFTYVPAASPLAAGGVDYVTAFAYDADGNESEKAYLTIGSNVAAGTPCALFGEFGDGKNTTSVVADTYGQTSRVPYGLVFDRWEIEAYDATGAAVSCTAVVDILATDYATDSLASITASEQLMLSSQSKNSATSLTGWTKTWVADTLFRAKLVSFTGAPTKIVIAVRGVKS
jgi:hypothetical protein